MEVFVWTILKGRGRLPWLSGETPGASIPLPDLSNRTVITFLARRWLLASLVVAFSIASIAPRGQAATPLSPAEQEALRKLEDAQGRLQNAAKEIWSATDRSANALVDWMKAVTGP